MRPVPRRLDHPLGVEAGLGRHREAPRAPRAAAADSGVDRHAAREGRRVGAHLGAALHARVPADGHEAGARPAHVAARQGQVDDRPHVVRAEGVLGEPHRPDEDRRVGGRVHGREALHVGAARRPRAARARPSPGASSASDSSSQPVVWSAMKPLVEPAGRAPSAFRTPAMKAMSPPIARPGRTRRSSCVPNRALSALDGHPVALEAGLAVRVHHRHLACPRGARGRGTS